MLGSDSYWANPQVCFTQLSVFHLNVRATKDVFKCCFHMRDRMDCDWPPSFSSHSVWKILAAPGPRPSLRKASCLCKHGKQKYYLLTIPPARCIATGPGGLTRSHSTSFKQAIFSTIASLISALDHLRLICRRSCD